MLKQNILFAKLYFQPKAYVAYQQTGMSYLPSYRGLGLDSSKHHHKHPKLN